MGRSTKQRMSGVFMVGSCRWFHEDFGGVRATRQSSGSGESHQHAVHHNIFRLMIGLRLSPLRPIQAISRQGRAVGKVQVTGNELRERDSDTSMDRRELLPMRPIGCNLTATALHFEVLQTQVLTACAKLNPIVKRGFNDLFSFLDKDALHCYGDVSGPRVSSSVCGSGRGMVRRCGHGQHHDRSFRLRCRDRCICGSRRRSKAPRPLRP
jgi:hypothetical protein